MSFHWYFLLNFCFIFYCNSFSTSLTVGIPVCAPNFSVDKLAAVFAKVNAVFISAPFAICTENAPFNVSPAPVVSTTLAGLAGTVNISPVSKHVETPFDPWVINNFPAYFLRSSSKKDSGRTPKSEWH